MNGETDIWREHALAPPPPVPDPDAGGLAPAGDQAHTIPQAEAADWVREYLTLMANPATRDDSLASIAAYRTHLTPLCQLAGVTEAAARVLRLAHGALERSAGGLDGGSLTVQPWLFRVTALRAGGDADAGEMDASPAGLWAGVCDAARFTAAAGEDGDGLVLDLVDDETVLRLAALFSAAAAGDEDEMAVLVDGDLPWPRVSALMMAVLARLTWAAGHMFPKREYDATAVLAMSVCDTGTVPDLAGVLRRERPGIDLDVARFLGD